MFSEVPLWHGTAGLSTARTVEQSAPVEMTLYEDR